MRRPRLLLGTLTPGSPFPFPLLPDGGGDDGGGGDAVAKAEAARKAAAESAAKAKADADARAAAEKTDRGFPVDTPVEAMTATQQVAYWKAHARKHEDRNKDLNAWRAANEAKVADYDRLEAASKSEHEKAIDAAKAEAASNGKKEGRSELVPQLVAAEFLAAARGALTREQVGDILAPLDKTYFLDDAGVVDTVKVTAYVEKVAGVGTNGDGRTRQQKWPDTGGGRRGGDVSTKGVQAGRELYLSLYPPTKT